MSAARSQKLQEEGGELHVPREATSHGARPLSVLDEAEAEAEAEAVGWREGGGSSARLPFHVGLRTRCRN